MRESAAVALGLLYHFGKYWQLFQLTHDPILKVILSNRERLIDDLKETFHADRFSKEKA